MRHFLAFALFLSPASAQIVEDFEHGNEALYMPMNSGIDTLDIVASAAHDGSFGAQYSTSGGPSWRGRLDLVTAPGNTYDTYFRTRGATNIGRSYVGIGASVSGCAAAVAAPNTNQILLQDSTNWGFTTLASAPFTFAADTWYVLRHEWAANGDMTVHLLDESGSTTLVSTPTVSTTFLAPGGVALRGFTNTSGTVFHDLDSIRGGGSGGIGTSYCSPGVTNSTGAPGVISATGSTSVAANDVTLRASSLPNNAFGFFLTSRTQGLVNQPGGSLGRLCLGGSIGRYVGPGQIQNTGTAGEFSLALDLTQTPTPTGFVSIAAGETWNFQSWHRDSVGGMAASNFTDGLSIAFQ